MPKTNDGFTDQVLEFASEIVDYMINEIQGGSDWYKRFDALSHSEKKALYKSIADGFNDSTDD